jgi:hypothetical protein
MLGREVEMLAKHWSEEIALLGETVRDNTAIEPSCAHRCGRG